MSHDNNWAHQPYESSESEEDKRLLFESLNNLIIYKDNCMNEYYENFDLMMDEYNQKGITDINYIFNELASYRTSFKIAMIGIEQKQNKLLRKFALCLDNNQLVCKSDLKDTSNEDDKIKYVNDKIYYPLICKYKDYCEECRIGSLRQNDNYCTTSCSVCKTYRKEADLTKIQSAKITYHQLIDKKDFYEKNIKHSINNKLTSTVNQINLSKTNINNTFIHVNNINMNPNIIEVKEIEDITNKYIYTRDNYFNITISIEGKDEKEMLEKIKAVFILYMCGRKGIELFPNEPKYSSASTFPVVAAIY